MRIAWFSTLESELAGYSTRLLLPELSNTFEIDHFAEQGNGTKNYLAAIAEHKKNPYDIFFYNFDDTRLSNFVRMHMLSMPGITWFHNFVLKSFGPEPILNSPWQAMVSKFKRSDSLWWKAEDEQPQIGPQACREAAFSIAAVFSNPVNCEDYTNLAAPSFYPKLSRFVPLPVPEEAFLIQSEAKAVAFAGTPSIESRAHALLTALSDTDIKLNWLIDASEENKAQELLNDYAKINCQFFMGRDIDNWIRVLEQSSMAVCTSFSLYDNLGYLPSIAMAAGYPCVLTDFAGSDFIPSDLVFKVEPGAKEASSIKLLIKDLVNNNIKLNKTQAFSREMYALDAIVAAWSLNFKQFQNNSTEKLAEWNNFLQLANRDLMHTNSNDVDCLELAFKELAWT